MPSNPDSASILWLEDNKNDVLILKRLLEEDGLQSEIEHVESGKDFFRLLPTREWDILLCDHDVPEFNSSEALEFVQESYVDLPLIFVSGATTDEDRRVLLGLGAFDLILKDHPKRLSAAIRLAIRQRESNAL